ncbi:MAG: peptidylprolyl isomerase [Sphingobium sp.]|nr:peptidylprolyl isomerase [Sphingobium sp.]
MKPRHLIPLIALVSLSAGPIAAQDGKTQAPPPSPSPGEIAAAAPATDWKDIAADDLLVMTLAPDAAGKLRKVLIQLLPAPFSQGWVGNIRTLARAHYWDGLAIYRVQDNYVTQWGDPEDDEKTARKKPDGLREMPESDYEAPFPVQARSAALAALPEGVGGREPYGGSPFFFQGWPVASAVLSDTPIKDAGSGKAMSGKAILAPAEQKAWPVHCYGMVGVARGQRPSTGDGSTLYTVIGHAPRHLDRNIALAGRVAEGMEHLSSLPRGPGAQGFYDDATMRVPIVSVRLASDLPAAEQPHVQYLSTESASFARYADARAHRRDPFFLAPADGADICNIPVPIRRRP